MINYGLSSIYEFLGDMVVFRNLIPQDSRLPEKDSICRKLGFDPQKTPRKTDSAYASIVAYLLNFARKLDSSVKLSRLIFIGDTRVNDVTAFLNIAKAGDWKGIAFIGNENNDKESFEISQNTDSTIFHANRWQMLGGFDNICSQNGFTIDEQTAVIFDLDKTTIGARGRNHQVIDQARVEAVKKTVGDYLGNSFDQDIFKSSYHRLNKQEFHTFTADNQDYLAYICLIIGSGMYTLKQLIEYIANGQVNDFSEFMNNIENQKNRLPHDLLEIHKDIFTLFTQGDPTPFKTFRYNEFQETCHRMGSQSENSTVEHLMSNEIVITQEVREVAIRWKEKGALLLGLSDKPDESSIPNEELRRAGYVPVHHKKTHSVGC